MSIFVNAIARRVAYALVALLLVCCGVGKAHATVYYPTQPEAYTGCMAHGAGAATASFGTKIGNYCTDFPLQMKFSCHVKGVNSSGNVYTHPCGLYDSTKHNDYRYLTACSSGFNSATGLCFAPEKNLGGESCSTLGTHCGNPINVAIGNKYQREDDLRQSPLLYFSRHYNSHPAARSDLLGRNWTHSYSRAVEYLSGPQIANVGRPDGRRLTFVNSAGQWKADADVAATLVRRDGPAGELLGWKFTPQNGHEVEEYDAIGRLLQITSSDGRVVVLGYNNGVIENNANDFRLTRVQDQDGRSLVFEYDTSRRISKMTDSSGSAYVYGYDSAGNLASVTYPGGKSCAYVYNESAYTSGANLPTALTGIVREDTQRFATFTYAATGKAISTEHVGGVEKVMVQYNADGSARTTQPLGQVQQRAFTTVLAVKKVTSIVESCTGCTTRSYSYSYDINGYPNVVTDARGMTTDYDHNSRGLVNQRLDSTNDAGGNKRTMQTDWHTTFAVPIERRTYDAAGVLVRKEVWTYNNRGQVLTHSVNEL